MHSQTTTIEKNMGLLVYTRIERLVDEGCQTSSSNVLAIEVSVVFAFPKAGRFASKESGG